MMIDSLRGPESELSLMLKGTRTAMSFVAEARRLAISDPYPAAGQPGYSTMADVLARAVLFANWEVVGAGALVRAGSVTRVVEIGLKPAFRSDEYLRRLTWRMVADATHELAETPVIEDGHRAPLDIAAFVARRRQNRADDRAARPTRIGRITIQLPGRDRPLPAASDERAGMPRAPKGYTV